MLKPYLIVFWDKQCFLKNKLGPDNNTSKGQTWPRYTYICIYIYILVSQSIVHLFPFLVSVYSPPPSQSIVHVPFGTIKIVVWDQFWQESRGWGLNEIIVFLGCRLLKIAVRHRQVAKIASFCDSIVLEFLQAMPVLVRPCAKNAVKIGVSGDVVCLSGCVVVLVDTRGP